MQEKGRKMVENNDRDEFESMICSCLMKQIIETFLYSVVMFPNSLMLCAFVSPWELICKSSYKEIWGVFLCQTSKGHKPFVVCHKWVGMKFWSLHRKMHWSWGKSPGMSAQQTKEQMCFLGFAVNWSRPAPARMSQSMTKKLAQHTKLPHMWMGATSA